MYEKMSNEELIERATNKSFEFSVCKGEVTIAKDAFTELLDERTALANRLSSRPKDGWVSGEVESWKGSTLGKFVKTDWPVGTKVEMRLAPPNGEGS